MNIPPFTITADIDLGQRIERYLVNESADVNIYEGHVPETIKDALEGGLAYQVSQTEFLLTLPSGTRYWVKNGQEIIYHRGPGVLDRDVALFLLGSAWGALCYQRGLLPLHASAICFDGGVYAFTGNSGAGKSTLSAALADQGYPFFTDDTLIIDPHNLSAEAICYSGQKDLKLWQQSFDLTQANKMDRVRDQEDFTKFFAQPAQLSPQSSGPLKSLFILSSTVEDGASITPKVSRLKGGQALLKLSQSVYRPRYATQIWGRKKLYEALGQLIAHVDIYEFNRSFMIKEFPAGVDFMKSWITAQSLPKHESATP